MPIRAIAVIVCKRGKYAALMHASRGGIEIPAGRVEPGETLTAAVKRELFEETGLRAKKITRVCRLPSNVECTGFVVVATGKLKSSTEGYAFWATEDELLGPMATFAKSNRIALDRIKTRRKNEAVR